LLNGFISKEMFFAETVYSGSTDLSRHILPLLAVVASAFSVAYSLRFISEVFFGPEAKDLPRAPHEPPLMMLIPSAVLVISCLVVGILPGLIPGPFLHTAVESILGDNTPEYSLAVWHGFNLPLLMSFVALLGGIALRYILLYRERTRTGRAPFIYRFDGRRSFEALLEGVEVVSAFILDWTRSSRLQPQLFLIILLTMVVAMLPLLEGPWMYPEVFTSLDPAFAGVWIAGAGCAVGAAAMAKYHRPAALLLTGGAGLCTVITFAWLSAPDLALTQLTVEVVTMVLILLGLRWLPPRVQGEGED